MLDNAITIHALLRSAENNLPDSDTPRLDAEILLCKVLDVDRAKLYAGAQETVTDDILYKFHALLAERKQKKPVAYLTGRKEFWSMSLAVNEYTLIPRSETECLVEFALEKIPQDKIYRVADLGTGSGAIALAIAKERPHSHVTATDICAQALTQAQHNAGQHTLLNIRFIVSKWFENIDDQYNVIISNPPYIKDNDLHLEGDGVMHEPTLALCGGADGLDAIRTIIRAASAHLLPQGWLLLEHGYDQARTVQELLAAEHFTEIMTRQDYAGRDRASCGRKR